MLISRLMPPLKIIWSNLKYKCELHKAYGELPLLRCYAGQLSQVVMNLIVNAGQAIEEKGDIWIKTYTEEENLMIEIKDNGPGIPKENIEKLFDPFFTTKPVGEGTGLGLSISYGVIKKHGGKILVESEVGRGTTFTLQLPLDGVKEEATEQGSGSEKIDDGSIEDETIENEVDADLGSEDGSVDPEEQDEEEKTIDDAIDPKNATEDEHEAVEETKIDDEEETEETGSENLEKNTNDESLEESIDADHEKEDAVDHGSNEKDEDDMLEEKKIAEDSVDKDEADKKDAADDDRKKGE